MKLSRIYLDTSVIVDAMMKLGQWIDEGFQVKKLSAGVIDEISKAPQPVQETLTVLLDWFLKSPKKLCCCPKSI